MTTTTQPTYTRSLTYYRKSGGVRQFHTPAAVLEYIDANPDDVTLILGVMRPGYLGREVVKEDDLRRWVAEDESAAEWAAISDGERAMQEMGALR